MDALALALPVGILLAGAALGWAVEALVLRNLVRWAKRLPTRGLWVGSLLGVTGPLVTLLGACLAVSHGPGASPATRLLAWRASQVLVLAWLVLAGVRLLGRLVSEYGGRARVPAEALPGLRRVLMLAAGVVGALFVLDNAGVRVTPLLTTLGIAGLAVALALQDTLANFFAGVYVQSDKPLAVGHYVRLEEQKIEGFVVSVGWRTTKLRTLGNNLVVLPNSRLASSIVTDYSLPEPRMGASVSFNVERDEDVPRVEGMVLEEVQRAAREVPGLLADPPPTARYNGPTEFGHEIQVNVQVASYTDQYLAMYEIRRRVLDRFEAEGVGLAVPVREVRGIAAEEPRSRWRR